MKSRCAKVKIQLCYEAAWVGDKGEQRNLLVNTFQLKIHDTEANVRILSTYTFL